MPIYTRAVDTKRLSVVVASLAALLGALWARNRPVKPPDHAGDWKPHGT